MFITSGNWRRSGGGGEEGKFNQSEEVSPTRCRVAPEASPLARERSPPGRGLYPYSRGSVDGGGGVYYQR